MSVENRCPICGAVLPQPGGKCPFCAEALQLVQHLASADQVRLCSRCGAVLEEGDEGDLCARCRLQTTVRPPVWRREDRIARWLRDHIVEPPSTTESVRLCPRCGKAIPAHSAFCLHCGAPVDAEKMTVAEAPSRGTEAGASEVPAAEGETVQALPQEVAAGTAAVPTAGEMAPALPADEAISGPAPVPAAGETASKETFSQEAVVPPSGSLLHRLRDFWQEQFRPAPTETPVRERVSSRGGEAGKVQPWFWILLGLLLLGLVGMALFWTTLLNSGGIVLR